MHETAGHERGDPTDFSGWFSLALAAAVVSFLVFIPVAIIWIAHVVTALFPAAD